MQDPAAAAEPMLLMLPALGHTCQAFFLLDATFTSLCLSSSADMPPPLLCSPAGEVAGGHHRAGHDVPGCHLWPVLHVRPQHAHTLPGTKGGKERLSH